MQEVFKSPCFESYKRAKLDPSAHLDFYAAELNSNFGLSSSIQTKLNRR